MSDNHVLVVEDEETLRHIILSVLEEKGYQVRVAETAEKGLSMLWNFNPAVALLDIVLPGMNGLQFLREVKRISPDTEVIVMTSQSTPERAQEAMANGAFHFLEKPFTDLDTLWQMVNRAMQRRDEIQSGRVTLAEPE